MSDYYWLTEAQIERLKPYFTRAHGVPRVDDRRVISGIIHVLKRGLQWRDAPAEYGPHKTLCNRFKRWSEMGVFDNIFKELSSMDTPEQLQIDAPPLECPPHRLQPAKKGDISRCIGRTKGGLNSELHAVFDGCGRPVRLLLTGGQISDYEGARTLLPDLPSASFLLADKGCDANWFRDGLIGKGIWPCIPPKKNRKYGVSFDKTMRKQRHRSKTCSDDWKTGGASQPDTTAVHTPSSSPQYAPPLAVFGGYDEPWP